MILEGLLVDLVPYGNRVKELDRLWHNSEASFWGSGGDWHFTTKTQSNAGWEEWTENRQNGKESGVAFAIQTKDGVPIGYMGINWIAHFHRLAQLGAQIGPPEYWGGGYGTDALLLLLDYTFDWLDVRKAWLTTTSINARVIRQMEKIGFTFEGRQREGSLANGKWIDWLFYGMFQSDWPGRAAMVEKLGLKARKEDV